MAKLGDLNPQATRYTFTMCPGTDVYMPPEAVKDEPVYTEKIDIFSFGVIAVQIMTQQFPKPGTRRQEIEINHPGVPQGLVEVRVSEVDRRQNHICQIEPNYPLLPIALDCLKDKDIERPSAQQLCERVANLKERPEYGDSVAAEQQESQQLHQLQQIQQLYRENEREVVQLRQRLQESQQLQRGTQEAMTEKERELGRMRQQAEIHEQERANFERRLLEKDRQLHELEGQLRSKDKNHQEVAGKVDGNIELAWREGKKAPFAYKRFCDAVVDGNRVYFQGGDRRLFTYNINDNSWLRLSDCPFYSVSLVILNGQPTTIGGRPCTDKLMSLTDECEWTEKFPPMPTKQMYVTVVCTGTVLIVAGGLGKSLKRLTTVEVLNFENSQWSTAVDLPKPLYCCSAAVNDDQLYMLGDGSGSKSVYTCSVSALLQPGTQESSLEEHTSALSLSNGSSGVWSKLHDLPVIQSTCVTFCGQLLAIGGMDSDYKPTTAVYMYNQSANSWNTISHTATARKDCFAAVLPNNQLMVVGGQTKTWTDLDSVEFGNLI